MYFCKVFVLITVVCSNIPYGNSELSSNEEMLDQIKSVSKVWKDEKTGKSFEYLIRFNLTNFLDALESCRSINYQLLAIDSEEEFQFIHSELLAGHNERFWTSGVDIIPNSVAGQQIWATNGLPVLTSIFLPGQPDFYFYQDSNYYVELCLCLISQPFSAAHYLHDVPCSEEYYVICKNELKP